MKTLSQLQTLNNRTAVVTGGAGHLGHAICESLAELGANIIIASRDQIKCEQFANILAKKFGIKAKGYKCDVTVTEEVKSLVKNCIKDYKEIDILINNAWSGKKNSIESISDEDWQYDIEISLNSPFYVTKNFLPHLMKTKGIIVNISSMYGLLAPDYRIYKDTEHANPPSYGAAKAGIIQLTKYLASFLAPYDIRVNSISPGAFPYGEILKNTEFIKRLENKTILGRIGHPEDLKGVIAFLCSDASKYVTGQNISIDGGWSVW